MSKVPISRWFFSVQTLGNQTPCTLQLCYPIGSWWKRVCGKGTFVLTALAWKCYSSQPLISYWWEFIPEPDPDPDARMVRNVACGWAATSWLQLCSVEKEKRWKEVISCCYRKNWKCQSFMCNICSVYCLIEKEQGRNFPSRSLMVVLFIHQDLVLCYFFHGASLAPMKHIRPACFRIMHSWMLSIDSPLRSPSPGWCTCP